MLRSVDEFAVDDFGRFYLCDDEGNPFSRPYDTLEEASAALDAVEADDEGEAA